MSLSIANHAASLPIAYKLYLPEDWASDPLRRSRAGVPDNVAFHTKPEIALDHIRAALAAVRLGATSKEPLVRVLTWEAPSS